MMSMSFDLGTMSTPCVFNVFKYLEVLEIRVPRPVEPLELEDSDLSPSCLLFDL